VPVRGSQETMAAASGASFSPRDAFKLRVVSHHAIFWRNLRKLRSSVLCSSKDFGTPRVVTESFRLLRSSLLMTLPGWTTLPREVCLRCDVFFLVEVPNQLVEVVITDGSEDLSGLEALLLPVGGYDILAYLNASEDLILC
jgi:hypothetical protein